ncbi:ATP synthase F1 subunit gamma [Candidatus Peregrinibacteria bacterium CG1_02_54_53]|nr:MAG: ATP synthase F1 subunit gamma [Candidatus Peregrinibacteria bacterium CG1_02_54_53]
MKAIKATHQVTKAMELVAASKMRRAVSNAQKLRHYAFLAWQVLQKLADVHPELHPYLQQREPKKILAILFTPDRGMCGNLNAQLLRTTTQYIQGLKKLPHFQSVEFIAVGRKGQQFLPRLNQKIVAAFPAFSSYPTFKDVLPIVRMATEGFLAGTYDSVSLIYSDFVSALVQESTVKVLLPFSQTDLKSMLESLLPRKYRKETQMAMKAEVGEYLFEPSADAILQTILPQLTEIQVYQAILEAGASEHSARMVAMRAASDNATDLLDDLTIVYNQTRQANITAELAELSAAKAALK